MKLCTQEISAFRLQNFHLNHMRNLSLQKGQNQDRWGSLLEAWFQKNHFIHHNIELFSQESLLSPCYGFIYGRFSIFHDTQADTQAFYVTVPQDAPVPDKVWMPYKK